MSSSWLKILCALCTILFLLVTLLVYSDSTAQALNNHPVSRFIVQKYQSWRDDDEVEVTIEEVLKGPLPQNDSRILEIIQSQYLLPPSDEPYNLSNPQLRDPSKGQAQVIKKLYNNKSGGVFVECGGYDGETRSNSLSLERDFGWTGILIEGGSNNFKSLKAKNRKAWAINSCLSINSYPHEAFFNEKIPNRGKISGEGKGEPTQCFPFFSIMSAMNISSIDYFSLDVEGHELKVLQTIPFDSIEIKALSVEYLHTPGSEESIINFMKMKGYSVLTRVINRGNLAHDLILVHKSIMPKHNPFPTEIKSR